MVRALHIEWKRRLTIVGIVTGVLLGYRYLLPVTIPFLAAWILAVWLYPVSYKLQKKTHIKKTIWGSLILAVLAGIIGIVLYWGFCELVSQIKMVFSNYYIFEQWVQVFVNDCCGMLEEITGIEAADSRKYILVQTKNFQRKLMETAGPSVVSNIVISVKSLLVFLSGLVVTFIMTILIIGDMESMQKKIWEYQWLVGIRRVIRRLKKTIVTYLKAQIIIMILVSAACTLGFWILKSPYFLILGIVLGIMDAIPLIGTGIFLYPAAILFLIKGNTVLAVGCVVIDIVTSLLREFLEPRLLGERLGVSPISVLASVYIGFFLFGAWGVLLGPLSFSTIYEIGREWDIWD